MSYLGRSQSLFTFTRGGQNRTLQTEGANQCSDSSFIIAKKWKQSKCSSTDERINKIPYIHEMKCHLAIKGKEVLMPATTWMDLESMMLSFLKISQKGAHIV
jgi:hypothetical protein